MEPNSVSLLRILPACLTEPLPPGWDMPAPGYLTEVMPAVERPEVVTISLAMTEPDLLILDADFPGSDPFQTARDAVQARPDLAVLLISRDGGTERMRRAMLAGTEEFLVKPFDGSTLRTAILNIAAQRKLRPAHDPTAFDNGTEATGVIVGVASGKGGLGKTTVAANLAAAVVKTPGKAAALVGLESGDGAVMLSLQPKLGLLDLAAQAVEGIPASQGGDAAAYSPEWLKQFGAQHKSGIGFWSWQGSATPGAGAVPDDFLPMFFEACRKMHSVTLIDFPLLSADEAAAVLPLLDIILVVSSTSDLLALRSTKTFLSWVPPELEQRVRVVINRADPGDIISRADFEESLDYKVAAELPNSPQIAAQAINMGAPFVLTQPNADLTCAVRGLAANLFKLPVDDAKGRKRFGLF